MYDLFDQITATKEVFWANPKYSSDPQAVVKLPLGVNDVRDAEARLARFAPYIAKVFPETQASRGIIESPLRAVPAMKKRLESYYDTPLPGQLWMKLDSHLPISGSIKARGGIYEVLKHAEDLALKHGLLTKEDDYSRLADSESRRFYSNYAISVGSTGNLGLSIGIMSAKLGFNVTVHMSADAKEWKKDLLRRQGVRVIEYDSDYSRAVEEGRKQAEGDPHAYFIDDENSKHLFLGYAVAALRLEHQLKQNGISVDEDHPLFVYLPCGVGGGPGGITFGLKLVFGPHVHCFFAEPTHSPAMLLGLMTGLHDKVSVHDYGLDNKTDADGLAVGRPSRFVGKIIESILSGVFTVSDDELYRLLTMLADSEGIYLEPSALAGVPGAARLIRSEQGRKYLRQQEMSDKLSAGTHLIWATGGSMVPGDVMSIYYQKGARLLGD